MNVLLISVKSSESKGGIAVWTEHYLNACKNAEIDCTLINTAAVGKRLTNASSKRNIKDEFIRTKKIFKDLKKTTSNNDFDVAHLNTSIGAFGIMRDYYIAKHLSKKKIPIIAHFHCDIPFWSTNKLIKLYLKKFLSLTNTNFVLCSNSKTYLEKEFNKESVIVPNFINKNNLTESKTINEKISKCVFVGRISALKGAKEIYSTADKFPKITFTLIGEVTNEMRTYQPPDNIKLLGKLSHKDVIKHLDEADLFIFPSHTEGFSMALAEAMARGLPAIASDAGANSDMLENKGGIIVPINDAPAICEALKNCMQKDVRTNMSCWCIEKCKNNYTTENVLNIFSIYYKKCQKV